jgi:hypothetical protein
LSNFRYFICRAGKQIRSLNDGEWLEIGIAATLIDGLRSDFRELIISLVLLRFAAESHGMSTKHFFDNVIQNTNEKIIEVLTNVRDHEKSSIHFTVQTFGDPEWVSESIKEYGEHSLVNIKYGSPVFEKHETSLLSKITILAIIALGVLATLFLIITYLPEPH